MTIVNRTLIFVCLGVSLFLGVWYWLTPKLNHSVPSTAIATVIKPTKKLTSFNLIDQNGQQFTDKSLRGHWTLMFFGYTGCPDICPQMLGTIRDAWGMFHPQKIPARFAFINIEPAPIASEDLKQFVANYNENFIGLTGNKEEVTKLCSQLGVFSQQLSNRLEHTATLMLIDPQGSLAAIFTPPFTAQAISTDLELLTGGV